MGPPLISSTCFALAVLMILQIPETTIARRGDSSSRITPTCLLNQTFTCRNQKCIPLSWKCDGDSDCDEGEDELNCDAGCNQEEFECVSRGGGGKGMSGCIPKKWHCDGEYDCEDHSDENDCPSITCKQDQFKCSEFNGQYQLCIPLTWKCDGQKDCASGDDEKDCQTKQCDPNDFQCANGVCIFKNWRCDGEDDCGDNSDERNCTEKAQTTCESKHMFKCEDGKGCVPKDWRCDGESDCMDLSDEKNCTSRTHMCALPTQFSCATGSHCINRLWLCDGEPDCPDASDEAACEVSTCSKGEKACPGKTGQCFPESAWCNGVEDCPDGSDEEGCPPVNVTVPSCNPLSEYKCASTPTQCVPYKDLCTNKNKNNCGDDTTCSQNITICNPGSDYCTCHDSYAKGFQVCYCPTGYQSVNKQCVDVNECENFGVCDQLCHNVPGSYFCSCHPGYKLSKRESDTVPSRCRALGGDPIVLLSNRATIRQFDLVTNEHLPLIQSPGSAVAMDFHRTNGTLIWSDIALQKILMCQIGNDSDHSHLAAKEKCADGEESVLFEGDVHTPDGLAIDWVHNLLFWTDGGLDQINVMNLDTRKKRTLFTDKLEEPRAIAVDPEMGLIFWTDWGKEARIERAGMDGSHRTVIVRGTLVKWPNGLALDLLEKRIYWADAKVKSIFSANYWGEDIKVVLHSHSYLRHPFSLAVFEDRVYYTDWEHDGVITVNKFTGGDVKKVMGRVTTPMTVRIYHKQAQPEHSNKCKYSACEHMCLPTAALRAESKLLEPTHKSGPFTCVCDGGADGNTAQCVADMLTGTQGFSLSTMFFLLALAVFCVIGYVYYRGRTRGGAFTALNFDNPIYRRTVETDNSEDPFRDPFRDDHIEIVPSGPTHVEQPSKLVLHDEPVTEERYTAAPMDQHLPV